MLTALAPSDDAAAMSSAVVLETFMLSVTGQRLMSAGVRKKGMVFKRQAWRWEYIDISP